MPLKIAFSGLMLAGKDYVASQVGGNRYSFAEPMYRLATHFFGYGSPVIRSTDAGREASYPVIEKTNPSIRSFLQTIDQWGWGCDAPEYPFTPERALFTQMMREQGPEFTGIFEEHELSGWPSYGKSRTFWVDLMLYFQRRWDLGDPEIFRPTRPWSPEHVRGANQLVTNARFPHEHEILQAAGYESYLVLASDTTRIERLGRLFTQKEIHDISEQYAWACLREWPDERIIWNDHRDHHSGRKFLTLPEFLTRVTPEKGASK